MSFFLGPAGLSPPGCCSARGALLPVGQVQRLATEEVRSFRSALLFMQCTISSGAHRKQGPGAQGTLVRGGRYRAAFPEGAKERLGHGRLYGTVGGSGQRLVSNLVGEDAQCKPLKIRPKVSQSRVHRTNDAVTQCPWALSMSSNVLYIAVLWYSVWSSCESS